eukprot:TRINITY_DN1288_c0_g1_i1.p1 TRINITY_DN1288_c0_g1~~TRINITY_DN1288_c0_g1_i1.p1  ORF type:complete len:313 (-),score=112.62 TRINITY_DN1288_c0_g1_i1:185-1123(-)
MASKQKENNKNDQNYKAIKDFSSGTIAGMAGKIVGFPFDTVKVILQTQNNQYNFKGPLDCALSIFRKEGFFRFYKGMMSPVIGGMAENAILFAVNGQMQILLKQDSQNQLTLSQNMICGAVAGFFVSSVLTPIEYVKCQLQVQNTISKQFRGPLDVLYQTIKTSGLKGIFRGHSATIARETLGNAAWFGSYEFACSKMMKEGETKDNLKGYQLISAGAFAGMCFWAIPYPADLIKSKMQIITNEQINQIHSLLYNQKPVKSTISFLQVTRYVIKTEGFLGLYRGLGVTLCRAIPANATIFYTFEVVSRFLRS